jgi:acetate kinase
MRELEAAAAINSDAALAIEIFCYRIRKYIGAYMAVLGRVDAIIFSAGIGEHSANVRGRVCSGLEPWGIEIDEVRNRAADGREACFSADASRTALWVVPLDEELQIARAAARLAGARGA